MKAPHVLKIVCLLCVAMMPAFVQAQFAFTTNSGAITITGYTGSGGVVVIPGETNGYPVTSIGSSAFTSRAVTSVTIPGSVTNIGSYAFGNCSSLTNIMIPYGVTSIGSMAFGGCNQLVGLIIPDSVNYIGASAFSSCSGPTSISLSPNVSFLGDSAFCSWAF